MSILDELFKLKGKEATILDLDNKVDNLYEEVYFEPIEFNKNKRVYKYRDFLLKISYIFNEKESINILDTVKITEIEATF